MNCMMQTSSREVYSFTKTAFRSTGSSFRTLRGQVDASGRGFNLRCAPLGDISGTHDGQAAASEILRMERLNLISLKYFSEHGAMTAVVQPHLQNCSHEIKSPRMA